MHGLGPPVEAASARAVPMPVWVPLAPEADGTNVFGLAEHGAQVHTEEWSCGGYGQDTTCPRRGSIPNAADPAGP